MLTTKQFADLCSTTKRTIIHYDNIRLLQPKSRNDKNRAYSHNQVLVFQKIQMLKTFGLTLSSISKYLKNDSMLTKLFEDQKKDFIQKKNILEKRLGKIDEFIANLHNDQPIVVPKIVKVNSYKFYALGTVGRYVDIDKHQQTLFNKINDKKVKRVGLTVFFDENYSPHQAKMKTGALISEKNPKKISGIEIIKVPSYTAVVYTHAGPYSYLSYVWQFLNKFVKDQRLKRNKKITEREFYLKGPIAGYKPDDLVTELHIPLE